ncbi:putative ac transposase [Fusarium flagelliforme]|uniref:Putative ac transposase n=1 Tax=Fusarium flagelliforme TaxID=2675880 RepID=A0A395MB65_9HYPO|nr:putative ac transposase [Fusarium flagelliforme]
MVPNSTSLTPSPVPTSSPTPTLSPAPVRYHEPPDEFVQDRITYVKRATITKKGFRLGSSHIWKYGLQYIRGSDKKEVYYCHECTAGKNKQEFLLSMIDPQSGIKKHSSTRKSVLDQQKSAAATNTFFWKDSLEKFKELLIGWIVYCHIAFFQLENRYFRELLFFLNPALLNHLPKAAKTIRSWVMDAFLSKKQRLREDLQRSRSRISISFDLWTSPNPYAILGVIAMWIDTTGKRRTTVLSIRRVYGEHTGENLGSVVLELLKEYDIGGDEIGYFMLDNASSNDTAVGFILKELCPWMDSKQRRHRRLRCLGHIVNLCCQAFLMGRNCEKYLAKLEKHYQRGDYEKVEELWKEFGCLGRLHNLVRYIRLTPQRREEFAAIIIGGDLSEFDGLELIQNNSTRWNSWFHSITRVLNVRERLEIFSARHVPGKRSQGIANFKLDGQHWFELEKIELALKDFYAATLLSEGKKTSLADWFSTLDCLLREISETKDHYHDIHSEDDNNFTWKYLQSCADAAWSRCAEYYNNQQLNWQNRFPEDTDLPPAYYAAQILDPYRKKERAPDPAFDRQREHKRIRTDAPVSTTDLYEQYISTDRLHDDEAGYDDAIAYWLSRYDSQRDLARFALDLFAISPMSDECERLFSIAKLTIVDRRGRLKADIIEACECLRAWYGKPQVEDDSDSEDSENDNEWIDNYS